MAKTAKAKAKSTTAGKVTKGRFQKTFEGYHDRVPLGGLFCFCKDALYGIHDPLFQEKRYFL